MIASTCAGSETGREHTNESIVLEPVDHEPGRCLFTRAHVAEPSASQIVQRDAKRQTPGFGAQVCDRIAIDFVFADRQWLQALAEALRTFIDRRNDIHAQVEGGFALAVEPAADFRRPIT